MHIAIIDDNGLDRKNLLQSVSRYADDHGLQISCEEFCSAEEFFISYHSQKYDFVFLDIYMNQMDGMEAARKIYADDPRCRLIFFTVSRSHAVESYGVRAVHYLTKPLSYDMLRMAMDACCLDLAGSDRCVFVHVDHIKTSFFLRDILYADCISRKAAIHLKTRDIFVDESISLLNARLLNDPRFLCCNRNVVVNMDHIKSIEENDFLLINGTHIPIRKRGTKTAKLAFLTHSLQDLRKENQ